MVVFINDKRSFVSCRTNFGGCPAMIFNEEMVGKGIETFGKGCDECDGRGISIHGDGVYDRMKKRVISFGRKNLPKLAKQALSTSKKLAKDLIASDLTTDVAEEIADRVAPKSKLASTVIKAGAKQAQKRARVANEGNDLNVGEKFISDRSKSLLKDLIAKKRESRMGISANGFTPSNALNNQIVR